MDQQTTAPATAARRRVPDKPTVDGLEERWAAGMGGAGHLPVRPHQDPRADLLDRHPAADGQRRRCTSGTSSPTRTPTSSRATSGCAGARSSTRWAGTTTGCRPSAGCSTTTACAATRRCPTTPTSRRRRSRTRSSRCRSRGATSSSSASSWTDEDEQAYEALWRRLGLSVDWTQKYTTIGPTAITAVAAGVPAQPRPRRGVPGRGAGAVGRHLPDRGRPGRARGPRVPRPLPPGRVPRRRRPGLHRDDPARADPARASPWSRTPTTSATSPCSARRCARRCSTSRSRCSRTTPAEPDKGAGIAMVCTFGDLTDVLWWRELHLPIRSVVGRDGRLLPRHPAVARRPSRRGGVRRAGRQDHLLGARRRWSTSCARPATSTASRRPTTRMANFYENGDKPLEIVTSRQWYIRNGGRDDDLRADASSTAAARSHWVPGVHAAPLRELGRRASTATG